ncbi:hypothetical protein [Megasphaera sueciensis]|uniref:hypothetical protein n=1 Tax=Megasphaera sueciensis TaxID=349094 RepID=UPI003D032C31
MLKKTKMGIGIYNTVFFELSVFIYIIYLYSLSSANIDDLLYAIVHGCFSVYIIIKTWKKILHYYAENDFPLILITLLMFAIYYELSCVKYFTSPPYFYFVQDNLYRFLFSIFTGFLILGSVELMPWLAYKNTKAIKTPMKYKISKTWLMICIILLIYTTYAKYSNNYISPYLQPTIELTMYDQIILFANDFLYIILSVLAVAQFEKKSFISKIPIFFLMGITLAESSLSGSRYIFFHEMLILFFLFLLFRKINLIKFTKLLIILPGIIILVSLLAFNVSGRYSGDNAAIVDDLSYRFELSDYPLALIHNRDWGEFSLGTIQSGIIVAIPSIIIGEKNVNDMTFSKDRILSQANLSTDVDYADTYFSMGTENFGIVGFITILPFIIFLLNALDIELSKMGPYSPFAKISFIQLFTTIELEWLDFFPEIRNGMLTMILLYVFYKLAIRSER